MKICGITSPADAEMCEDLGADALGFVHVPGRRRSLPVEEISSICSRLGPMTTSVIVCSPRDADEASGLFEKSGADVLQVHSLAPEELSVLRERGIPIVRAVSPNRSEAAMFAEYADALLFEGGVPGTGTTYDYSSVPMDVCRRVIVAGGLTPDNVHLAKALNPYAVDTSSGVEDESGKKSPRLVAEFVRRCRY